MFLFFFLVFEEKFNQIACSSFFFSCRAMFRRFKCLRLRRFPNSLCKLDVSFVFKSKGDKRLLGSSCHFIFFKVRRSAGRRELKSGGQEQPQKRRADNMWIHRAEDNHWERPMLRSGLKKVERRRGRHAVVSTYWETD